MSIKIRLPLVACVAAMLFVAGSAYAAPAGPKGKAAGTGKPKVAAAQTVVLGIEGMMCSACSGAVQTALKQTKGVKSVKVAMDKKEATVAYDPRQTNPRQLVGVVDQTKGMAHYSATIKKKG